ncbi:DnaD domain protein [Enterococcus sp. AZ050]|uniref:DnaD domain protein n=1 Tax=Enterococcus sp. AZ050 TaxID=2774696 RepID=UPI0019D89729|nr:DnaD domain protein [Enterococcus faecalis]
MTKYKNNPKKKRYYWLQLKEDFFNQKEIKLLRRIAGGDTYTIIYLKMLLLSLRDEGKLYFEAIGDNFSEEIALTLDEAPEDVSITINYLENKGLLEIIEDDEYFLNRVPELLGSESYSADRVRRYRERKKQESLQSNEKALQSNGYVTESNSHVTKRRDRDREDIEKSRSREEGLKKIYHYYESNGFGTLAQKTMQDFDYWITDFEKIGATQENAVELIIHALGIAIDRNKRNYGYANAILKDWEQNKYLSVKDVEANDKKNKEEQQTKDQWGQDSDYADLGF